ncbi:hypothetical protein SBRCBS47491_009059 [Sporothrix bragantina]|uniref:WSC domain-containing protein n=1 Tax=Sporothrix bragantina TaxID=671064 RepID=A0ABP0CRQ4_9PEZI
MKATAIIATALSMLVPLTSGLASTDTITWGGDNSRTGYQTNHNMDPAIVGSADFAQIFKTALPGNYNGAAEQIFSQPLVYTPSTGTTQYVYFATTQNNVYKLDAKTGNILLSRNLAIPFLTADLSGCVDINPLIGVTSTGVIDPDTDTLYLMSKTYANQTGGNGAQGRPNGRYYLHALDTNDLTERANFPVNLEGIVARNNDIRSFNGGIQHQRPGLLHSGQYIYAGFASHCVQYNFTGWLMGFDKTTGAVVERYATEGEGVPNTTPGGGIWMSGGGLASDDQGSLFFGTGNGYASQLSTIPVEGRNPPTALEEAAVHMTLNDDGSVTIVDFFMPQEKQALDGADKDLGTSPLELLPSEFSCGSITHMGVITGKSGKTYFLNLDDLGGYRTGTNNGDRVIQVYQNENSVYAGAGVYPLEGGYIYINVIQYPTHVFKFSCVNGVPSFTKVADSPENNAYTLGVSHGTVTTLNGEAGTGLLWTTDVQGNNLRIYNAVPENGYLTEIRNFTVTGTTKFTRAVFGDGRMYMGTTQGYVYGFGAPTTPPLNCSTPVNFGSLDIVDAGVSVQVNCTAVIATTINSLKLTDPDFTINSSTTFPATLAAGAKFSFTAQFKPTTVGLLTGTVSIATTNGVTGYSSTTSVLLEGTGLSAGALLSVSPTLLTYTNVVLGANPGGVQEPVIFSNQGNSTLTISDIQFSQTSASGPWQEGTVTSNGTEIGPFVLSGLPSTIASNGGETVEVTFNPTVGGNFTLYVQVITNGGNQTFEIDANAGPGPTCLLEFQTPDGLSWVEYKENMNFTFGNVTENTSLSLLLRVTNNGTSDAVPLSLTVSKPPFGVAGIIGAANQIDLAEGTVLKAGQSATASLYCAVPKEQWNTDTYYGAANWTMNTNDPNWDKQYIQFSCVAVSEQAPPLQANGQGVYRYAGCFKENNPGRQLSNQLYSSANNTAAMCIAACAAGGYTYCGTQYNSECWAGNSIPVQEVADGDCNYPCSGSVNQICGGNGVGADAGGAYISLYAIDGASTSTGTAPGGPVVNPGDYGYISLGCYHEPATSRALANQLTVTNQTVDTCLAAAALGGYKYAGLEYGGECWVGATLSSGAAAVNLTTCTMTCNNNGSEYCGGSLLLNMYELNGTAILPSATSGTSTSATSKPTGPVVNPGDYGYTSLGCYHEPATGRALANQLTVTNQTVDTCLAAAALGGYKYAGLEYGGECWVGATLSSGAAAVNLTTCTMTCNNNGSEYCGGSLLLNVYELNGTAILPSATSGTSTSASSKPTGPVVNPGDYGYISLGCYHEPSTGRALTNQLTVTSQTVDTCLAAAALGGYKYAGLEYGGECWVGATLSSGAAAVTLTTCAMTCNNNGSEYCGGSLLLNLYELNGTAILPSVTSGTSTSATPKPTGPVVNPGADGYQYIGCWNEPATGRAFTQQLSVTSQTVDNCLALAAQGGYTYAGLEYGGECWVGNSINSAASKAASTACTMTCNGNKTELCGGSLLLDLYQFNATAAVSSAKVLSTATSSSAESSASTIITTTSQTSSTTTTAAHTTKPTVGNWVYQGCYTEATSGRALAALSQTNNEMTYEECASYCSAYAFFGVEYGDQCYCGNYLTAGSNKTAESDCSTYCAGDASELCGSGGRLNVYYQTGKQTGPPVAQPRVGDYVYTGCYSEATAGRALASASYSVANMTQESCAAYCAQNSFTLFGVEYATQCYCGNSLGAGSTLQAASSCNMACGGSAYELCGGPSLLNVFSYSPAVVSSSAAAAAKVSPSSSVKSSSSSSTSSSSTAPFLPSDQSSSSSTSSAVLTSASSSVSSVSSTASSVSSTSAKTPSVRSSDIPSVGSSTTSSSPAVSLLSTVSSSSTSAKDTESSSFSSSTPSTSSVPTSSVKSATSSSSSGNSPVPSDGLNQPVVAQGNANFTIVNCFQEPSSGHLLSDFIVQNSTSMTVEMCVGLCDTYVYAGLESGSQCWCGNTVNLAGNSTGTAGSAVNETQCDTVCPGNTTEYCGAVDKLLVYNLTRID